MGNDSNRGMREGKGKYRGLSTAQDEDAILLRSR